MRKLALYTCAVARGGALERAPVKERSLWARPATSSSRPPDFPRLLLWADASREETAEGLGCGCCFETSMPLTTREQEALPESRFGGYRDSLLLLWRLLTLCDASGGAGVAGATTRSDRWRIPHGPGGFEELAATSLSQVPRTGFILRGRVA